MAMIINWLWHGVQNNTSCAARPMLRRDVNAALAKLHKGDASAATPIWYFGRPIRRGEQSGCDSLGCGVGLAVPRIAAELSFRHRRDLGERMGARIWSAILAIVILAGSAPAMAAG